MEEETEAVSIRTARKWPHAMQMLGVIINNSTNNLIAAATQLLPLWALWGTAGDVWNRPGCVGGKLGREGALIIL